MKKSKKTPYIQHDWEKMAKKALKTKDSLFQQFIDEHCEFREKAMFLMENENYGISVTLGEAYQQFLLNQKPKIK